MKENQTEFVVACRWKIRIILLLQVLCTVIAKRCVYVEKKYQSSVFPCRPMSKKMQKKTTTEAQSEKEKQERTKSLEGSERGVC